MSEWSLIVMDMQDRFCKPIGPAQAQKEWAGYYEMENLHSRELPFYQKNEQRQKMRASLDRYYPGNMATLELGVRLDAALTDFRKAGFSIVHVYTANEDLKLSDIHFTVRPKGNEKRVRKTHDDAFKSGTLKAALKTNKVAICGVNTNSCVFKTACSALNNGIEVHLLLDLVANNNANQTTPRPYIKSLQKRGAFVTVSQDFLENIGNAPRIPEPLKKRTSKELKS